MQLTDWLVVSRATQHFKATAQDIVNLVTDNIGTSEFTATTIADRDTSITTQTLGDRVYVTDASTDGSVDAGWAIYTWTGSAWKKVAEEEGLDVVIEIVNLGNTPTPTGVTITNSSSGSGTLLPLADAINAGLMTPAMFTQLGHLTVTAPTDLDDMRTKSHVAVTTAGTAQNNPIQVDANQVLSYSIESLDTLP